MWLWNDKRLSDYDSKNKKKKEKGSKLYFWEHKRKEAKTKHKIKPEKLLNDKYQFGEIITIFIINNFLIYIKKDYH